jgi:ubiquinone/menaquinone biosynthesis C-methylase UbiE
MSRDTYYRDHWVEIEPERLDRYEQMFQWTKAYQGLLEPARIEPGHVVADFGCGPGAMAVELARQVGAKGHVHAMELNADFIARTRAKAEKAGFSERITAHRLTGGDLPLEPDMLDRLVAKNVMVYVDDPLATFREFRRVIKPGGKMHAVDSDWATTIMEPVPLEQWRTFLAAASHAFRNPLIGRRMFGIAKQAGFSDVELRVVANPDTEGRYLNLVHNLAGYAREGGRLGEAEIQAVVDIVEGALKNGTFLAINPHFMVTATV